MAGYLTLHGKLRHAGKKQRSVKKIRVFRLHILRCVVELLDPTASPGNTDFTDKEDMP